MCKKKEKSENYASYEATRENDWLEDYPDSLDFEEEYYEDCWDYQDIDEDMEGYDDNQLC